MNKLIGLCGFIGSGKGTVASILVNEYGFVEDSFAATLKDAVAAVFGWPRHMLEGDTAESRQWREQVDPWWSEKLGKEVTPRWVLQYWGTDLCRVNFHEDIWIYSLERKLLSQDKNIVIADCRFPNEIDMIRRLGGEVWRVKRGPEPEWYNDAVDFNSGKSNFEWVLAKSRLQKFNVHPSEYRWVGAEFNQLIENESTLEALEAEVGKWMT